MAPFTTAALWLRHVRDTQVTEAQRLVSRQTSGQGDGRIDPTKGTIDPHNISNTAVFVLFGIIGAGLVMMGIWFFMWAKNGGFYWKETDWDDYTTSVVSRAKTSTIGSAVTSIVAKSRVGGRSSSRRSPDSIMHEDTRYHGGAGYEYDDTKTAVTAATTTMSGFTAGVSDFTARFTRKKERERRRRAREARGLPPKDLEALNENAEIYAEEALNQYRSEKPAPVGGFNMPSESTTWDGSAASGVSDSLLGHQQATPTSSPTKKSRPGPDAATAKAGAIRKVYSTAHRNADAEERRVRKAARDLERELGTGSSGRHPRPPSSSHYARDHSDPSSSTLASSYASSSSSRTARSDLSRTYSEQRAGHRSSDHGSSDEARRHRKRSSRRMPAMQEEEEAEPMYLGRDRADDADDYEMEDGETDIGTKSYHHPYPELRGANRSSTSRSPGTSGSTLIDPEEEARTKPLLEADGRRERRRGERRERSERGERGDRDRERDRARRDERREARKSRRPDGHR